MTISHSFYHPETIESRPESKSRRVLTLDEFGRPLKHLRVSVTDQCDLRCSYCFPAQDHAPCFLKQTELLSFDEIVRLTRLLVELGVHKVKITGGEPLLRPGLITLIKRLADLSGLQDLSLTTNGSRLAALAGPMKDAGLNRLTVSLDTLDPVLYRKITGSAGDLDLVLKGITVARKAGFDPIKINVVVQRGVNDHQVLELARWARAEGLIIRFIEVMDVGTLVPWSESEVFPNQLIRERINAAYPITPLNLRDDSSVAQRFVYADTKDEVGFISSVTHPFCGDCGRLRLSCDGKLYKCLFSEETIDARKAAGQMNDTQLKDWLYQAWRTRSDRYSENRSLFRALQNESKRGEMYRIGG